MTDILLEEFFSVKRWEEAIESGVVKEMPKSQLRIMCSPELRLNLYQAIKEGNFEIAPPHEARIPKDNGEFRTVYVNEPLDRIVLSIINNILFDTFPEMIHPACTSYQKGIGCGKVVQRLVKEIGTTSNHKKIGWKADLSKYFDSVPLEFIDAIFDKLEYKVGKSCIIEILRKYYHSDVCFNIEKKLIDHYASLKQGCAVASFLADVMLYETDMILSSLNGYYVRYSDDIVFIGKDADKAMAILKENLAKMQMKLNPKKVEDLYADRWFKFLGFNIKGTEITISKGRVKKFQKEIESRTIKRKSNRSPKQVVNSVHNFLYIGDGQYSWATSVLPIVTVDADLQELNKFVMDAIRASLTGKTKIGGLGSATNLEDRTILRGTGRNVKANREKLPGEIAGYMSIIKARNALVTNRAAYDTLVRQL